MNCIVGKETATNLFEQISSMNLYFIQNTFITMCTYRGLSADVGVVCVQPDATGLTVQRLLTHVLVECLEVAFPPMVRVDVHGLDPPNITGTPAAIGWW